MSILETNIKNTIKIFSRKCNSFIKDAKLSISESKVNKYIIKKLKSAAKSKTGTILKLN